jgi:hypothetical protein
MLPDFIDIKKKVTAKYAANIGPAQGSMPSKASRLQLHEGDRATYIRRDGKAIEIALTAHQYQAVLHDDMARGGGLNAVNEIVRQLSDQITRDMTEKMRDDIARECATVGTPGQPITPDVILQLYEKIETDFDSNGEWIRPNDIDASPAVESQIRHQMMRIEQEPDLRRRLEDLIAVKRAKWRDREANRKLVD